MKRVWIIITIFFLLSGFASAEEFDVLRSFGIDISYEAQESVQAEMDDIYNYFAEEAYAFNRYETIFSILGYGEYDESTYQYVSYSNDVYAFDAEAWDIIYAYQDLLAAIERMSDGKIHFANIDVQMSDQLFYTGEGRLPIRFTLNGEDCHYIAEFYYDWMDCAFIDYINQKLEEQESDMRVWSRYDGGQGLILLCGTEEWVDALEKATGCVFWNNVSEAFNEMF